MGKMSWIHFFLESNGYMHEESNEIQPFTKSKDDKAELYRLCMALNTLKNGLKE